MAYRTKQEEEEDKGQRLLNPIPILIPEKNLWQASGLNSLDSKPMLEILRLSSSTGSTYSSKMMNLAYLSNQRRLISISAWLRIVTIELVLSIMR